MSGQRFGYWLESDDFESDRAGSKSQNIAKKCCLAIANPSWPRNRALMIASQSNLVDEIVTIKVGTGDEQTTFQWLKSILEFHSPFFIGALEHSFKEAEKREIELPEDDADVFAEFLGWTTDHHLSGFDRDSDNPDLRNATHYFWLLARLYIFADKYHMPRLQNVAIDSIIVCLAKNEGFPHPNIVNHIYAQAAEDNPTPLCWLLTIFVIWSCPDLDELFRTSADVGDPYCQQFTQMVLCNYVVAFENKHRTLKSRSSWLKTNRCLYHVREIS